MDNIYKHQVVITDRDDYIVDYKDFTFTAENQIKMESYINFHTGNMSVKGMKINITRWNDKGERV